MHSKGSLTVRKEKRNVCSTITCKGSIVICLISSCADWISNSWLDSIQCIWVCGVDGIRCWCWGVGGRIEVTGGTWNGGRGFRRGIEVVSQLGGDSRLSVIVYINIIDYEVKCESFALLVLVLVHTPLLLGSRTHQT